MMMMMVLMVMKMVMVILLLLLMLLYCCSSYLFLGKLFPYFDLHQNSTFFRVLPPGGLKMGDIYNEGGQKCRELSDWFTLNGEKGLRGFYWRLLTGSDKVMVICCCLEKEDRGGSDLKLGTKISRFALSNGDERVAQTVVQIRSWWTIVRFPCWELPQSTFWKQHLCLVGERLDINEDDVNKCFLHFHLVQERPWFAVGGCCDQWHGIKLLVAASSVATYFQIRPQPELIYLPDCMLW